MPAIALLLKLVMPGDVKISYTNRTFTNDKLSTEKKSCIINVIANVHLHVPMEKLRNACTDVLN